MADYDAFGDVQAEARGIFGATQAGLEPGLKKFESVHAVPTRQGVVMQLSCQGCGLPTQLTVEWPEIVALKYGVNPVMAFRGHPGILQSPTRWEFRPDEHAWRPDLKCNKCGFWFPMRISPDEPEKWLATARRRGFINQAGEAQVSQIAASVAQAGQAVRR